MWSAVGDVDDYVVGHVINPAFMGGPRWPAMRQSFLKVTLPDGLVLMASDGLSDPYDDDESPNTGLGVEVYWIAPLSDVPVGDLAGHWQFSALYQLAQNIVFNGSPVNALGKYGAISMTISPTETAPDDWYDSPQDIEMGSVFGMTLAGVPREVELPGGTVRLAGAAPLRPDELDAVLGEDGQAIRRGDRRRAGGAAALAARLARSSSVLPV